MSICLFEKDETGVTNFYRIEFSPSLVQCLELYIAHTIVPVPIYERKTLIWHVCNLMIHFIAWCQDYVWRWPGDAMIPGKTTRPQQSQNILGKIQGPLLLCEISCINTEVCAWASGNIKVWDVIIQPFPIFNCMLASQTPFTLETGY